MKWMRAVFLALITLVAAQADELMVEAIAANPELWPKEVTVNVALKVPMVVNGQSVGTMNLPAGRTLPVKTVSVDSVVVTAGNSPLPVSVADTDLLSRAAEQQKKRAALAAIPPVASAYAAPVVKPAAARATPTPVSAIQNSLAASVAADLVAVDGRKLKSFTDPRFTGKKYLAVYYSASWCGPCRQFTPEFVKWYRRYKARSDLFEVVFVSNDRSAADMEQYMLDDDMPWPALNYASVQGANPLAEFAGRVIPCLVIINEKGEKVLDSYAGETNIGPQKILERFEELLKEGPGKS